MSDQDGIRGQMPGMLGDGLQGQRTEFSIQQFDAMTGIEQGTAQGQET
jgi:hypothetical protein